MASELLQEAQEVLAVVKDFFGRRFFKVRAIGLAEAGVEETHVPESAEIVRRERGRGSFSFTLADPCIWAAPGELFKNARTIIRSKSQRPSTSIKQQQQQKQHLKH